MHAVIRTGGKQYKVAEGEVLDVERLAGAPGDEIELAAIMLFDGADVTAGANAGTVKARLVDERKGPKLTVFKYKAKTGYRKKNGHRQIHSRIEIVSISPG
ncbi:MAG: 50S ribosomal protein L21 [Acidimicrobiia bacterium]